MIKDRLGYYKEQKRIRDSGKLTGLPVYKIFPVLGKFLPTIPKEIYMQIIAGTSVGKTQMWKFTMFRFILDSIENPKSGVVPFFYINLLEESTDEFIDSVVTMCIFYKTGRKVSKLKLNSFTEKSLSNDELNLVEQHADFIDEVLSFCSIQEIGNPTGWFKFLRNEADLNGIQYYKTRKAEDEDIYPELPRSEYLDLTKIIKAKYKHSRYEQRDTTKQYVVITDHIALFSKETINGIPMTKHETLSYWSYNYARNEISKKWKFTVWDIVQCTVYGEEKSFTNKGETIWEALKPGLHSIGTNKEIAQNAHICLMLFNPHRYATNGSIDDYDLEVMNGAYRSFLLRKNRIGRDQVEIPVYFDGEVGFWKELKAPEKLTGEDSNRIHNKEIGY